MKSSVARYAFATIVAPGIVVNAVTGAIAGAIAFPAGPVVPLHGARGACTDTIAASFVIGCLTLLIVAPLARLEARAGRVRGLGARARWLSWTPARVLVSALGLGAVIALAFGLPAARWLEARWPDGVPRDAAITFKALFSAAVGILPALVALAGGIASVPPIDSDPRWCQAPASSPAPVYPMGYMDKGALAVTSRERGCSGTPTWVLGVKGTLDPAHVLRALADVATRYPSITTKVQSLDGAPPVAARYRYAHDPAFRAEAIFDVVDAREPAALDALLHERRNRHTDLFTDFPVTLTLAITGDDSSRLVFRQHHALADGRAFIALLVDFAAFLSDARAGRRPSPEALAPIGRRDDADALRLSPAKQAAYTALGLAWLGGQQVRARLTPVVPLLQNQSNDYTGDNGTVHWETDDSVLDRWNAARKRAGVSLNTLLTGALFLANQRVHRARGLPVGRTNAQLLMETRPRDGSFVSFANHLTFLDAEADLGRDLDPSQLLRSIQAQVVRQRDRAIPAKRLLGERWFVALVPLEQLVTMIFDTTRPVYAMNFSNLIPLEFPELAGPGWRVDQVLITTPVAPRHGVVLTAIRYGGKVVFNFNYKSSAAPRELAQAVCDAFRQAMSELEGA